MIDNKKLLMATMKSLAEIRDMALRMRQITKLFQAKKSDRSKV